MEKLEEKKYKIENISISIECEIPKIDPKTDEMKMVISHTCDIEEDIIGITATTGEGNFEGIKAQVIVLISRI